jgi:hypothetical protein
VVHPATIGSVPESALELAYGDIERLVEVRCARLGPDDGPAGAARDFDVLTAVVLPSVPLVVQFHVCSGYLVVVTLDLGKFVGDVLSEMVGNHYVASSDDDFHLSLDCFHAASTVAHAPQRACTVSAETVLGAASRRYSIRST